MSKQRITENSVPGWFKMFNLIVLVIILASSIYIISSDAGDFATQPSGAGDIWWVDVPAINESYHKLSESYHSNK